MNTLWEGVKATAGIIGHAAVETGKKGKLQTDLVLINREMDSRKRHFGEELYNYVEPLSKNVDFFAAGDRMTSVIRGPLLSTQREISALDIKRARLLEKISKNDEIEKNAYVKPTNFGGHLQNAAKKTGFVSHHAKLKTELSIIDSKIRDHKQLFGLETYQIFVDLEDLEHWLPTVRDIRTIYDNARCDVEKLQLKFREKEKDLVKLGGVPLASNSEANKRNDGADDDDNDDKKPSYFRQAAAAAAENETGAAPPPAQLSSSYGSTTSYASPVVPANQNNNVAAAPHHQFDDDPFATAFGGSAAATTATTTSTTMPTGPPTAVPQQQQLPPLQQQPGVVVDPFAPINDDSTNSFGSFGSMPAMGGKVGGGSLFNQPANDPLGSSNSSNHQNMQQQQQTFDPLTGTIMPNNSNNNNNAYTTSASSSDDPFAGLAGDGQQQQLNPMFRY